MLSIIVAIVVLGLDRWTKWLVSTKMAEFQEVPVIRGFFSLQYVRNPGAAFGMLAHQQWLFITVSIAAIIGMLWFLRHPEARRGLIPWALGLLMGGAAGNLVDRVLQQRVVDFFLFYYKSYIFPNFNVADIAITCGVGLFILHLLLEGREKTA